jgi:hypothetical protein
VVEEFYIDNSKQSDPKWKGLKVLLRLPISERLQKMDLHTQVFG